MELWRKRLAAIFAAIIVVFLSVSFILNLALMEGPLELFEKDDTTLSDFVKSVQDTYKADVEYKDSYVNINGLFASLTGRNSYNGVGKLENGMLTHESIAKQDMSKYAAGIIEFAEFLEGAGIEYTYIQCPNKTDVNNELLRPGQVNYSNENADSMLSLLEKAGVDTVDFRTNFSRNAELVERYFYNTDHHWNTDAAFVAYNEIVKMLKERFPEAQFDERALDISSWNRTVYEDWFLGSHGRRVGKYYGGLDDLVILTPDFETDMCMTVPRNKLFYKGSFEEVIIREEFLDEPEYFDESPYCAYIGADYQIVHHINYNAKNDLKVLIIKDSFALAPQAFLSTQIRELEVIDPRYYTDTSLAEYVAATSPDMVITMVHPSSLFSGKISYSDTGANTAAVHLGENVKNLLGTLDSLEVTAPDTNSFKSGILTNYIADDGAYVLKGGAKYTVSIADAELVKGDCEGFTVALFDHASNSVISFYAFDFDNRNENGCYEWTFITPEGDSSRLKLLVYAGLHGSTAGNTLRFTDLTLSRWTE